MLVVFGKKFQKNGIPSTKINKISELFKNPQVKNRKMIIDYKDALIKKLKLAGNPLKFNFDKVNRNSRKHQSLMQTKGNSYIFSINPKVLYFSKKLISFRQFFLIKMTNKSRK